MEQIALFDTKPPYKYIIDTCSILSQKDNGTHRRNVYRSQWEKIDEYIRQRIIIACSEIKDEILDEEISTWLKRLSCAVIDIDNEVQENVVKIVTQHPNLVDFDKVKSSGDAFLIATAMKYDLIVITEENKEKHNKIPHICGFFGIDCVNITELCEREGWQF